MFVEILKMKRENGILLHIASLDGRYGIGTLGEESYRFIDFLEKSGVKIWQVLPLSPTSFGNSPYQSFSAFAGNPWLINLDDLVENDLLLPNEMIEMQQNNSSIIDYTDVELTKSPLLRKAFARFSLLNIFSKPFQDFCIKNSFWLDDYALFMSFKDYYHQAPLNQWDNKIQLKEKSTIEYYSQRFSNNIKFYKFIQFIFFKQWDALKLYAEKKGIKMMGDIPIYVAFDSADVWSNPELFQLDSDLNPQFVAGVPPDYFSETGQLWGNPVYNWEANKAEDYAWWFQRILFHFELFDVLRIDHFRAFSEFWAIPFGEESAINGTWKKAPGKDFFQSLFKKYGTLNIVAEDLGIITEDVEELRDAFDFPGMKILQFAFSNDADNLYLPHNFIKNCIVYTGTHDNDTSFGWFESLVEDDRQQVREYLGNSKEAISWALIRLAWASAARIAIAPMQDFLELGSEHRMNIPGTSENNWKWKLTSGSLNSHLAEKIKRLNQIYGR